MSGILTIALNDIRALVRDRGSLVSLFAVPVIMTIFLGLATSGSSQAGTIDIVRPTTADPLTMQFIQLLQTEGGQQFIVCDLAAVTPQPKSCALPTSISDPRALAETRVKANTTLAAVVIPASFDADLHAGKAVTLGYIEQGGLNAPQLVQQKVDAVLTQLNGALLAAIVVTNQAAPADDQRQAFYDSVLASAQALWASNPVQVLDQTTTGGTIAPGSGFGQSAPGIGAMFVMINALGLAVVFITERQTWTLQRLMVMPLARWQVLAGKLLGRYLLGLVTFAVMIGVGTLFGTRWGSGPGLIVTVLAYTLAVTAMALLFSTLVRSAGQARGIALLVSMTLAPLGGAWWPLAIVPGWMQVLGHISPIAWSQEAFGKLVFYNGQLLDVLPYVGVLLLFAAVFFAFGVSRFRYE